ncbi:hypothetical protein BYT27DRAFT_7159245 [Phlegmacium glaucopus]|nr:hypothetical protein BYT27DRAFT_7159245 [Phlegmacium glaucopus]
MSQFIVPSVWQPDRRTRDGLPLQLEDRTGHITNTDFDDMYDRMHFHVSRLPGHTSTKIFRMGFRPSRVRNSLPLPPNPEVSLDFGPQEALGTITLSLMSSYTGNLPMTQYLQKTSFFASSLSRKFFASDGKEYKWGFRVRPGQEWTCTTMDNILVAHYELETERVFRMYEASGYNLMVLEDYAQITIEIIASFLIMRHIKLFNL